MSATTRAWLTDLYGSPALDDQVLQLCWTADNRLRFTHVRTSDLGRAADTIDKLSQSSCTWVGCLPLTHTPSRGRGGASDTAALVGVWADIDIAGPGHKHPDDAERRLPVDVDEALQLLDDVGLQPTKVLHTGGGLQAWWLTHEPWVFESSAERAEAGGLVAEWGDTLVELGRRRGLHVDQVGDLARILRPAGTWNRKPNREPVAVRNIVDDGPRHYLADIEDVLQAAPHNGVEIDEVHDLAGVTSTTRRFRLAGANSPADVFARHVTWAQLLEPHGWRRFTYNGAPALGGHCSKCGARVELWSHSGVELDHRGRPHHVSATACHALYVFSDNPVVRPVPTERGITPFTTWALLEHDGDQSAAARAILRATKRVSSDV
jgi:hypothetical protein